MLPTDAAPPPSVGAAPPHSLEAEQSVLGAILLSDRTLYALVIDEGLQPEDFYRDRHATIYESILELYADNEPIDVLTVTEHLRVAPRGERLDEALAYEYFPKLAELKGRRAGLLSGGEQQMLAVARALARRRTPARPAGAARRSPARAPG